VFEENSERTGLGSLMVVQSREERQPLGPDSRFAEALRPLVDSALQRSAREEPRLWVQIISPILGPAIRLAVAAALRDLVQTLNRLLENSLSLRSWRWRVEAWRTGKPFAQVVLLRTLVYRVEQVLLVDRNSGLLLAAAAAPGISTKNSDLVSAMLTAIQEFVHDSFQLKHGDSIRQIHTGEFSLWVEPGPLAALAAAVRGNAPVEFHQVLRAAVDLIHEELGIELRDFQGDSTPIEQGSRPILEGCLQSRFQEPRTRSYWRVWVCAAAVGLALLTWSGLKIRDALRWSRALAALEATPGITITESTREHGKRVLQGLRDPFAPTAESVLAKNGISEGDVSLRLQPIISLDPRLLVRRVRAAIDAPDSVTASLDQGILTLGGAASHEWIVSAVSAAPKLALTGIGEVRTDAIEDRDLEALRSEIETVVIPFPLGSSTLGPNQARMIGGVVPKLRQWIDGTVEIRRVPKVMVVGHADPAATEAANAALSNQRAHSVTEALLAAGVPSQPLTALAGGTYDSSEDNAGTVPPDFAMRRNVVFRLSSRPCAVGREGH
jgi:outer membrane protein OmpA-like peptidoglycan-associated protein